MTTILTFPASGVNSWTFLSFMWRLAASITFLHGRPCRIFLIFRIFGHFSFISWRSLLFVSNAVNFPLCIHLVFKMKLIYSRPCPYLPFSVMIFCEHFPLLICFILFLSGKHRLNRYLSKKKKKKRKVEDIMIPFSNKKDNNRSIIP